MKLSLLMSFVALTGALAAQGATRASTSGVETVRNLHAEYSKVREATQTELRALGDAARRAERGSEQQKELSARLAVVRARATAPQKAFDAAFRAADWSQFDAELDAELMRDGLVGAAGDMASPGRAVEAGRLFLRHYGAEPAAARMRNQTLPMAMLQAGQIEAAKTELNEALGIAGDGAKAGVLLTLGDIDAATGRLEQAMVFYRQADPLADENTKPYVTLRCELVGKPAPDIDSRTWIGGEARRLVDMKGKVVLVDFWATWCPACRRVMTELDEMFADYRSEGLEVIGVTRFYHRGYVPADRTQILVGGESVQDLRVETFGAHVATFRANTGIRYPFVIGDDQDFKKYYVSGIPTRAVIDREGRIAMLTVGAGTEALLRLAIGNLLAQK